MRLQAILLFGAAVFVTSAFAADEKTNRTELSRAFHECVNYRIHNEYLPIERTTNYDDKGESYDAWTIGCQGKVAQALWTNLVRSGTSTSGVTWKDEQGQDMEKLVIGHNPECYHVVPVGDDGKSAKDVAENYWCNIDLDLPDPIGDVLQDD